ncbi:MAG: helix-turn-helix domain-containing protein [Lachnospiraceae bacterium]|nr:helix-turn-helix domain-containing protein [Lachnospiraceae bacterium]
MLNKYQVIRTALGKTQAEMAGVVGLSLRTIRTIEKENDVTEQTVAKYAAVTGIPEVTIRMMDLRGLTYLEAIYYISMLMLVYKPKVGKAS